MLHEGILKYWEHHTEKVPYVTEHTYEPDFFKIVGKKRILLESKGRFWDHAEYSKYIWLEKLYLKTLSLYSCLLTLLLLCREQREGKTVLKDPMQNGLKQINSDGIVKKVSHRLG